MRCPTTDEFADYLLGDETHHSHIAGCARCSALAGALRLVADVEDLDAALDEVERREAVAMAAVAELEAKLPHRWCASARADERLHSPEGVRRLLQRAAESYGVTPRRALALCQAAVTCAIVGAVVPTLAFTALKDFATYCVRVAGDLDGALAALDTAERFVPLTEDTTITAAIVAHARAYVYGEPTCAQWDRAISLLAECEPVFERCDPPRWRSARHLRAAVLLRRSDYVRAAELYQHLLATEPHAVPRARLTNDLAECYSRMGRAADALPLATHALTVLAPLGNADVTVRTMWTRGTALSGVGEHDEALKILESVARYFATAGMHDDELAAELSVIQALLARDPDADVAPRLERAYMLACAVDAAEPLRTNVRRAAVWDELRVAYRVKKLSNAMLTHASEYLRTIGRGDEAPFAPLH